MSLKKIVQHLIAPLCLMAILILPSLVLASSPATKNLINAGSGLSNPPYQTISAGKNDVASIVGIVIQAFLGLLGVIFLVFILYAGFNWMTAGGDEEKVKKAGETIRRAIIGLIIVVSAYAITYFVFKYMPWGAGGGAGGPGGTP